MILDLVEDISDVIVAMPTNHRKHFLIRLITQAILQNLNFIDRHPTTLFQCLWNRGIGYHRQGIPVDDDHSFKSVPAIDDRTGYEPTQFSSLLKGWTQTRDERRANPVWMRSLLPSWPPLRDDCIAVLTGHQNSVTALAVSPDEERVVSVSRDGTIVLWDFKSFRPIARTQAEFVRAIRFSPDGNDLATVSANGNLDVLCGWTLTKRTTVILSQVSLCCVHWLSTSQLVVGDDHGVARIWSLKERTVVYEADFALLTVEEYRLSGKDPRDITEESSSGAFEDSHRRCWSPNWRTKYSILGLDVSPERDGLVLITGDGRVHFCCVTMSTMRLVKSFTCSSSPKAVRFETNTELSTAHQDGTLYCWHAATGQQRASIATQAHHHGRSSRTISAFCNGATKDEYFVAFENEWWITRVDRTSPQSYESYSGHGWTVNSLVYMPRRKILVSGSDDATVRVWECNSAHGGVNSRQYEDPGVMTAAAVSSDGRLIVTGAKDGRVKLWSGETGGHLKTWVCQYYPIAIRFSDDERWIIIAEWEADIWVYDLETFKVVKIIDRQDAELWWEEQFGISDRFIRDVPYGIEFTATETMIVSAADRTPVSFLPMSSPDCLMSENGRTMLAKSGRHTSIFRLETP